MAYEIRDNKVYNENGDVAVIYSPGYGAGWYTWNKEYPDCVFDPDCVMAILNNEGMRGLPESKWENFYVSYGSEYCIEWVASGEKFRIDEYDGSERVILLSEEDYFTA